MRTVAIVAWIGVRALPTAAGPADVVPPCGACAAIVIESAGVASLPGALNGLPVLVRVDRSADAGDALSLIKERGGRAGLIVADPTDDPSTEVGSVADVVLLDASRTSSAGRDAAFALKTWLTRWRSRLSPASELGVIVSASVLPHLLAQEVAPYVDFIAGLPGRDSIPRWSLGGELARVANAVGSAPRAGEMTIWTAPHEEAARAAVLGDLAVVARAIPRNLIPATGLTVRCAGTPVTIWMDPATLDRIAWIPTCPAASLELPAATQPPDVARLSTGEVILRFTEARNEVFAQQVSVRASRLLTVEEIIARHQAAAARQAAAVRSRISTGTLSLTFEAPGFPAPITIGAQTVVYEDRERTEIEQRAIRVNGLALSGAGIPRLPLLEPERVVSMPLTIELTRSYRYTLRGTDIINGIRCYAIRFEPSGVGRRTQFDGTAWISAQDFGVVKVAATQTNLRGPIVSSQQIDEFEPQEGLWLLKQSRVTQVYEGATHRTPIERVLKFAQHEINVGDFEMRRRAAYASASLMLRDTPTGFRYLDRQHAASQEGSPPDLVADSGTRVTTIAAGVIVDPNITRPLPFAGLSYVDFNLFGTGAQFSGFFGGTFGQAALSVPSLGGSRWHLSARAFAIATSYHDRAFVDGRERYEWNLRQRPAQMSVAVLRPITPAWTIRAGYEFDYNHFAAADTTSTAFRVPASQRAHVLRVGLEGQRRGWNGALWWSGAMRQGWSSWGGAGASDFTSSAASFQRYGATLARSAVVTPALVLRGEAAWMGGHDLDRFSRYSFGTFDNRLRGYPGALIRYDRGAVIRGAAAWAVVRALRVDAFADSALVRDPGLGSGYRSFTGIGVAAEAPGPFGTLLALEWGYGMQARREDGRRGTHVVRVSTYKIF